MVDAQTLYNWAPVLRLMGLGLVVAAGPLAWIWWRQRGEGGGARKRLALLATLTLFLTFDLVLFGAFTRLTDSGLGCPDWPGCYGHASPVGASTHIASAQSAMPSGPVTFSKAWVEMIHRYLATGIGVLILVMAALSWKYRKRPDVAVGWPLFTLFWVCLQGAFGAWTVTMKLFPAIVTMHLLGGLVLLGLLRVQTVRLGPPVVGGDLPTGLRPAVWALFALLWVQIALGGWVSTNYAVLACQDFPTCQGSWWPTMDFARGFEWWRGLGVQASGEGLPFAALTAIHYTHRLFAYVVLLAATWLGVVLWRRGAVRQSRWLLGLAGWQLMTGLSNVVLEWPLVAAVAHTGGAAGLVVLLTGWLAQRPAHGQRSTSFIEPARPGQLA